MRRQLATFALRRVAVMVPVLLFLTAIVFVLDHLSPIDPARAQLGPSASPAALERVRHELWLDRPLPAQYVHYVTGLLHGDLGFSARSQQPVATSLARVLPATAELALVSFVLTVLLALAFGVLSARPGWVGRALRVLLISASSVPVFLLGIAGVLLFYLELRWLPASGRTSYRDAPTGPTGLLLVDALVHHRPVTWWDAVQHLVMPAVCVALLPAVAVGRVLRSSLLTTMEADHINTARSKGLTEGAVVRRHALRNAAGPALSMLGLQTGLMLAGVVVVETVFAWPGIGLYAAQAIPVGDFSAIAGVSLVIGAAYVVINAIVDVLQAVLDPRTML